MLRIQRYLFSQLLTSVLMSVGLFVTVLIVGNAIKDVFDLLASGFLSYGTFFKVMLRLVPSVIAYALPLGVLTGVLLTLGRLSAQMEIVAMRSVGLSYWHITYPVFIIGAVCSLGALSANLYYAPRALKYYRESLEHLARTHPTHFLQPHTFVHKFPGYIFYIADDPADPILNNFWIWELDAGGQPHMLVRAKSGTFTHDKARDALCLTLHNGSAEHQTYDTATAMPFTMTFDTSNIELPLDQIFGPARGGYRKLGHMDCFALYQALKEAEQIQNTQQRTLQKLRIRLEFNKNVSMALAVVILSLIAVPIGVRFSRAETFFSIGLAVTLGLTYYLSVIIFSWLEMYPSLRPDLLVWLPNALFLTATLYLFTRRQ